MINQIETQLVDACLFVILLCLIIGYKKYYGF